MDRTVLVNVDSENSDMQRGDIVVGMAWDSGGSIQRIRGNTIETLYNSPPDARDPGFFGSPYQVMIDKEGRVVFLAPVSGSGNFGLFRLNRAGEAPQKLGLIVAPFSAAQPGWNVPFALETFNFVSGLHLESSAAVTIDDDVDGALPHVDSSEIYSFVARFVDLQSGLLPKRASVIRYHVGSGEWEAEADGTLIGNEADMVSDGSGVLYTENGNFIRRENPSLKLDLSARIRDRDLGIDLHLRGEAFGGTNTVQALPLDNVSVPDVDGGCRSDDPRITTLAPDGAHTPLDSIFDVVITKTGLMTGGYPYLTEISQDLLDGNPQNDDDSRFIMRDPNSGSCAIFSKLKYAEIMPVYDPETGESNIVTQGSGTLAYGAGQIVGTQVCTLANCQTGGRVVQLVPQEGLVTVQDHLRDPHGIAVYPDPAASGTPSGGALIVRIDSPVNALVTDPRGRRIGIDPGTGQFVNDFGNDGYDSGPGDPRVYAIKDPAPGHFLVQSVGTGDGPFAVNVFSADLSQPLGHRIRTTGTAAVGQTKHEDFTLAAGGELAFDAAMSPTSVTVTVAGGEFEYDGSPHGVTGSSVSGADGFSATVDSFSYVGTGATAYGPSSSPPSDAGTYLVTAIYNGDANHLAGSASGGITIHPAASIVVLAAGSAPYDSHADGGTATVSGAGGLSQGLTVSYVGINGTVYGPTMTAPSNAGSYSASAGYAGDANHLPGSDSQPLTIEKVDAVFSIAGYNLLYDGQPHTAAGTATGVSGEDLSALLNFIPTTHTDPASYLDLWSFGGNANYKSAVGVVADTIAFPNGFSVETQAALNTNKSGDIVATVRALGVYEQATLAALASGTHDFRFVFTDSIATVTVTAAVVAGSYLGSGDTDFALAYRNTGSTSPLNALVTSANISAATAMTVKFSVEVSIDGTWYELGSEFIKAFLSKK